MRSGSFLSTIFSVFAECVFRRKTYRIWWFAGYFEARPLKNDMSSIFVIKIPGWRTFVIEPPSLSQLRQSLLDVLSRTVRSPIFEAIEQGRDAEVLRLATPQRLKRVRGKWGESPLVAAIAAKRSELAIQLIQRGGTFANDGALAHAAMHGDVKVVDALLSSGKNPDEPLDSDHDEGVTPLMWATSRKFYPCIERLLAGGANVNVRTKDGTTAAMYTKSGRVEDLKALEILCRYKPDITINDWRGRNLVKEAFDREAKTGNAAMRLLLERYYPDISFKTETARIE